MAASQLKIQQPPMLSKEITYANWKEEIEIWKDFIDLADEKKGPAVFLSLTGQARDAVRQNVPNDKLKGKDGVKNVLDCLDKSPPTHFSSKAIKRFWKSGKLKFYAKMLKIFNSEKNL